VREWKMKRRYNEGTMPIYAWNTVCAVAIFLAEMHTLSITTQV